MDSWIILFLVVICTVGWKSNSMPGVTHYPTQAHKVQDTISRRKLHYLDTSYKVLYLNIPYQLQCTVYRYNIYGTLSRQDLWQLYSLLQIIAATCLTFCKKQPSFPAESWRLLCLFGNMDCLLGFPHDEDQKQTGWQRECFKPVSQFCLVGIDFDVMVLIYIKSDKSFEQCFSNW